jgi:DNA (cytosine-5)-methyltransferase 1
MKVLNLYSGIGGNRKLWGNDHEITAVEYNESIAAIYKDFFPNDNVIVADAHEYLLKHYSEFDFIWASPPCPTHSRLKLLCVNTGQNELEYPDMKLYQEIIILENFFKGKYVVENVIGYYEPLITPQKAGRHYFWANFKIPFIDTKHPSLKTNNTTTMDNWRKHTGFNIQDWHGYNKPHKEQLFKNCVDAELGLHILNYAMNIIEKSNVNQLQLF